MSEITQQTQTLQVVSGKTWRHRKFVGRGFTQVPNLELDHSSLAPCEFRLYTIILSHAHNETGEAKIPVELLAESYGCKVRNIQYLQNRLEKKGRLRIVAGRYDKRTRKSELNTYVIAFAKNCTPLKPKTLKPNTSTPRERPREKSYTQLRWEWNQSRRKRWKPHDTQPHVGRCQMRYLDALKIAANNAIYHHEDPEIEELKRKEAEQLERDREYYRQWKQQKEQNQEEKMGNKSRLKGERRKQRERDRAEDYRVWVDGVNARLDLERSRIANRVQMLNDEDIALINKYMSKEENHVTGLSDEDRSKLSDSEYLAFVVAAMEEDYLDSVDFHGVEYPIPDCTSCSIKELYNSILELSNIPDILILG